MSDLAGDQIAALRERFRARALDDASQVENLADRLERQDGQDGQDETREYVRRIAHKLAGAAGTFGFASIGDSAAQLEDLAITGQSPAEIAEACRTVAAQIRLATAART